jgi:hypothetical protein
LPFAVAVLLVTPSLLAQEDKAKCRASFEAAQSLRDEGKLSSAREEMTTCTRVCPSAFAKLCEGWLGDVEKSIPTIVLRAVRGERDLVDVTIAIDGKQVATKIDGKAIPLDPGTHTIALKSEGETVTQEIVVAAGEKNRIVLVTFAAPKVVEKKPEPAPAIEPAKPPIAAIVVTGLGVVALGGFAYFGLKGDSDHHSLVDSCSKTASCSQDDKDKVLREWRTADVFLASGVVLVSVGTYLFLTHDSGSTRTMVGLAPGRATFRLDF